MSRLFTLTLAILMACAVFAQAPAPNPQQPVAAQAPAAATPAPASDVTRQMQIDIDQMDGLLNNMAAQVNFIRDTNMSILLNSNVRLWQLLIRDLRLQLQQQQQQQRNAAKPASPQRHPDPEK